MSSKETRRAAQAGSDVRKLVAIGASAGGLQSLLAVVGALPAELPCAIVIATHLGDTHKTVLSALLGRRSAMPVVTGSECPILPSTIYVAPPSVHLRVTRTHLELLHTPPIRFLRPNIDLFFQSVADAFGPNAIGVVLSGMGHDGAEGIQAIKNAGGVTFAEDHSSAEFPEMPQAAVATGAVDWVLTSDTIGHKLVELCMEPVSPPNG
jgi:two-component system, chemotaxis family, protein-glutamate methylesterase/glutaminase